MKINLDQPLVNLDGSHYKESGQVITVGRLLSTCLDNGQEGGRMKLFALAKKCYEGGTVEFDIADTLLLRKIIEQSSIASNVLIGQVLELFETSNN